MATMTVTQQLTVEVCCACGIAFAMPTELQTAARRNPKLLFYCPAGHSQRYLESEEDRLKRQLREARAVQARLEVSLTATDDQRRAAERSAAAFRGHATRLRNRAQAGRCPECHQQWPDVAEHMATEHPQPAPGGR
jgi:hypothetical protein